MGWVIELSQSVFFWMITNKDVDYLKEFKLINSPEHTLIDVLYIFDQRF